MIKKLLRAQLAKEERDLGESVDWARYLVEKAIGVFSKYINIRAQGAPRGFAFTMGNRGERARLPTSLSYVGNPAL